MRKDERGFDRELVDTVEADVVGGSESEFDERRAREEHFAGGSVPGKPRMIGEREPSREEDRAVSGEAHGRAKHWMLGGAETGRGDVGVVGLALLEPEAL